MFEYKMFFKTRQSKTEEMRHVWYLGGDDALTFITE